MLNQGSPPPPAFPALLPLETQRPARTSRAAVLVAVVAHAALQEALAAQLAEARVELNGRHAELA